MPGPYGVTDAGFNAKSLSVIQDEINAALRSGISPTLNLSSRSLLGQLVGVFASQQRQLWEAAQAVYAAHDPNQATGDGLTGTAAITGSDRLPATASTARMTITLAAGTYGIGTLQVNKANDTTVVFANTAEITTAGATLTDQLFECLTTGPTVAPQNTLTAIFSPVVGFSAPNNPDDATEGTNVETDAELRIRRQASLQRRGSSNVNAIRADILAVAGVEFCTVLENDTDAVDGNGLAAHSIWVVALGGDNDAIAQAIFDTKGGGTGTNGAVSVAIIDDAGNPHTIRFSRPTDIAITTDVTADYLTDAFVDDAAAEAAIAAAIMAEAATAQGVGRDVVTTRYIKAIMAIEGITDCTVQWSSIPFPAPSAANHVIGAFERAVLVEAQIFSVVTAVTSEP